MKSLGVLATHPIQYYTPIFRRLAKEKELELTVYYCLKPTPKEQGTGFGVPFEWDMDLLSDYSSAWLKNISKNPGLDRSAGLDTPEISELIKKQKYSAFLIMDWRYKSMWQTIRACRQTSTPLLVRGDSHLHTKGNFFKKIVKEVTHRYLIRKFSACLAVGSWSREYFEHYGAKNIFFSPHCVDNEYFSSQTDKLKTEKGSLRKAWGIPEDSFVFLFAGKFEPKKRPMDLLFAAKNIIHEKCLNEPFHILMVGDGPLKKECQLFSDAESLPASFAGFLNQSQMPKAYAVADALVLPSDFRETWGLVVNEAMACGLPAIVSAEVGCGPDLICEGETGFIYPCGDTRSLSVKMFHIAQDKIAGRMGENARSRIIQYSVENAAWGILHAVGAVTE